MKLAELQEVPSTIRFRVSLSENLGSEIGINLPADAPLLPEGAVVEGTFNAYPFRAVHKPKGHFTVTEALITAAGARAGNSVAIELTRVGDEPEVRMPQELKDLLAATADAQATWASTSALARRDWILWITTAKQEDTRLKRIEGAVDRLVQGKKRICCFPGLNWMTKDHGEVETWLPLPNQPKSTYNKA